ncbi:MAG: hypothetical protein Q8N83_02870 [Ignavibacteria bacterium]|nr:hypothetical protein [Ignavibacteria bacterium]
MNIFDEPGKIYSEIDDAYARTEIQARSKGHRKKEAEFYRKRQLNDQAYFLFMFTRFEGRVRDISDNLIYNKVTNQADWKINRTWEIINKQKLNDSLHFMNRVSLLTPKGQINYNLIKQYYDQRNNIGHGGSFTIAISIPTVIADMKRLYKDLKW